MESPFKIPFKPQIEDDINSTTHVRVFKRDHEWLKWIKANMGFRSYSWIIHAILSERVKTIPNVNAIMQGNNPVVLTGQPGSGKTYFVKDALLSSLTSASVLVVDSLDEYSGLRKVGYDFYSIDFSQFIGQIRYVLNKNSRVALTEVENIFAYLDMSREKLSNLVIIVEEAHAYKSVGPFMKVLYASRHFFRKIIVITPQLDAFQGLPVYNILSSQRQ